jgi:hypothetical protein
MRGRTVTRPRAGPRLGKDFARRPETLRSARRRWASRSEAGGTFGAVARGRADLFPRVFAAFVDFALAAFSWLRFSSELTFAQPFSQPSFSSS